MNIDGNSILDGKGNHYFHTENRLDVGFLLCNIIFYGVMVVIYS